MEAKLQILTSEQVDIILESLDEYDGALFADLENTYKPIEQTRRKRKVLAGLQALFRELSSDFEFGLTNFITAEKVQSAPDEP